MWSQLTMKTSSANFVTPFEKDVNEMFLFFLVVALPSSVTHFFKLHFLLETLPLKAYFPLFQSFKYIVPRKTCSVTQRYNSETITPVVTYMYLYVSRSVKSKMAEGSQS